MTSRHGTLEHAAFWLIVASLGAVQFNLLTAQTLFGLSAIAWVALAAGEGRSPDVPNFFLPLLVYGALTMVSAGASIRPVESFIDCKQLVLLLIVPIVARVARGERATTTINVIMALGAAGALVGVVEAALLGYNSLAHRPTGPLSHYMTYSGVLMLVTGAAAARLLFHPKQIIWPAIAVPALLIALAATLSLNAWLGTIAAVACLLALRRARLLLIVPVLIGVFVIAAPPYVKQRAASMWNPQEDSNRDRLQMLTMGRHIVSDHPAFGVGPDMIKHVYGEYLKYVSNPVHQLNPHLHNVPVQIAAERGLPALAAWLWFVAVALRDLWRQLRHGPARAIAGAGFAAVVAMLVAGMFEYNFGDSEFLMLFLGLITLPYAAAAGSHAEAKTP
jgi:O-antigen ligase